MTADVPTRRGFRPMAALSIMQLYLVLLLACLQSSTVVGVGFGSLFSSFFREQSQQQRQQQQQQQKQDQPRQLSHTDDSSDINHNPPIGSFQSLILLIQFSDHEDRDLPDKSVIEAVFRDTIVPYMEENSRGRYELEPVVTDWILTDNTEEYYSFENSGFDQRVQEAGWPALNALDNRNGWDWAPFDVDEDGLLDSVIMMHSGYSAIAGARIDDEENCPTLPESNFRIWDHAAPNSIPDTTWKSSDESVRLNGFAISSVYQGTCDTQGPLTPGLLTHEYMHTFDLIDLYDGEGEARGVGRWCLMSDPYGPKGDGSVPGMLSAWSRQQAGWLTPKLITNDGTYPIQAAQLSDDAYRINLHNNASAPDEYLLIENRQQVGFEEGIPAAGIMIYHVDDAADNMQNRGFPDQEGWPENGKHYRVAVLPKDGLYDLELNNNRGDAGDMWMPGDILGPDGTNGELPYPNTDSYQYGVIQKTGITIVIESQEEGGTGMTFRVTGLGAGGGGGSNITTAPPADSTGGPTSAGAATDEPLEDTPTPTDAPLGDDESTEEPVTGEETAAPAPTVSPVHANAIDEGFWVLTRPPVPTRSPVEMPEFPEGGPRDDLLGDGSSGDSINLEGVDLCEEETERIESCVADKCPQCEEDLNGEEDLATGFNCGTFGDNYCSSLGRSKDCCPECRNEIDSIFQCTLPLIKQLCPSLECDGIGSAANSSIPFGFSVAIAFVFGIIVVMA